MSAPPDLPPANAELRRLLAAGAPPDGNMVPLMSALVHADLIVPLHPEGGLLRVARAHAHRPGSEEVCLYAFTSHELAARWAAGVRDAPPRSMAVAKSTRICRDALNLGVDVVELDRDSGGYSLRFMDMMRLLSRTAFDGKRLVTFESVAVRYGLPNTPPPAAMLDAIAAIGRAHGLARLAWCMRQVGDAPLEIQLVFSPFPARAFLDEVAQRMNELTRDRFSAGASDAATSDIPAENLQSLL